MTLAGQPDKGYRSYRDSLQIGRREASSPRFKRAQMFLYGEIQGGAVGYPPRARTYTPDAMNNRNSREQAMKKPAKKSAKPTKTTESSTRAPRTPLSTTETRRIYRPDDFAMRVAKLFPLALGNPPSLEDVDAWEASKPKGCWDYWSFLDFISTPAEGKQGGLEVVLFHHRDSFQERPLEIVSRIHLDRTSYELGEFDVEEDFVEDDEEKILIREWKRLRVALNDRYGSVSLRKQKWLVGKRAFDVTFPDQ